MGWALITNWSSHLSLVIKSLRQQRCWKTEHIPHILVSKRRILRSGNEKGAMATSMGHPMRENMWWHCHCHLAAAQVTFGKELGSLLHKYKINPTGGVSGPWGHQWSEVTLTNLTQDPYSLTAMGQESRFSSVLDTSPCASDTVGCWSPALPPEWTLDLCSGLLFSWIDPSDICYGLSPALSPAPSLFHPDGMHG